MEKKAGWMENPLRRIRRWVRPVTRYFALWRDLRGLQEIVQKPFDAAELVAHLHRSSTLRPSQIQIEITRLLELLRESPPGRVCEIGAWNGGTTVLLLRVSAPDARVATVELAPKFHLRWALSHACKPRQKVFLLAGNSQTPAMAERVHKAMEHEPLDLLFIDGDHSYDGVKRDFELYAPFVRAGGLIVLHDIVPDAKLRNEAGHPRINSGDVPLFWMKLRRKFETQEFISRQDQHGFGLGVVHWPGDDALHLLPELTCGTSLGRDDTRTGLSAKKDR